MIIILILGGIIIGPQYNITDCRNYSFTFTFHIFHRLETALTLLLYSQNKGKPFFFFQEKDRVSLKNNSILSNLRP